MRSRNEPKNQPRPHQKKTTPNGGRPSHCQKKDFCGVRGRRLVNKLYLKDFWHFLLFYLREFFKKFCPTWKADGRLVKIDLYPKVFNLLKIGSGTKKTPIVTLRLIEVRVGKIWHSYLTSVLDPEILPPYVVIDLYEKRWRIEDASTKHQQE